MTKSELISRLSVRYPQFAGADAELAVKTILDAMTKSLGTGAKSGEKVFVAAKYVPHFKAGKELRERVDYHP
jgi:integration host factor subunit beta